jgi:tripartite-type tricarboxylate transporter receptor subunit TctC
MPVRACCLRGTKRRHSFQMGFLPRQRPMGATGPTKTPTKAPAICLVATIGERSKDAADKVMINRANFGCTRSFSNAKSAERSKDAARKRLIEKMNYIFHQILPRQPRGTLPQRLLLLAALGVLAAAAPAQAQPVATPFPTGKSVSIHVGTEPGGTNDLVMRMVARHIGKYLPGNPSVIPRNTPGAGGKRLATLLANTAARDGTEFGIVQRSVTTDPLLVDAALPFRMQELTWIGTPTGTTDTCILWHKARVQSLADLQSHELILAGTGNETAQALILQRLTGGKIRVVLGYPGGATMNIAMERGEADGRCSLSWEAIKSNYAEWLRDKKIKVLVQFALARAPDLPDVPLITELARNPIDQQALAVILLPQAFGFPFAAPPGLLPEVSAMLRTAFMRAMADPQLIEDAARIKMELRPVRGEELQSLIAQAYAATPETVARARRLVAPN